MSLNGKKKNSKENSAIFWVEGEKFKLRILPSRLHLCYVLLRSRSAAIGSGPDAKYGRASAFNFVFLLFFLSTTMVFAAVRTHFARKNTRVLILTELRTISRSILSREKRKY